MEASEVRQLVAEYLDRVRLFYDAVMAVDSGLDPTVSRATVFKRPDLFLKAENDFINDLLSLLNDLNGALLHAERWLIHLDGLASNLRLTSQERVKVFTKKRCARDIINEQEFQNRFVNDELSYLRWVTVDSAEELELLLIETRQLDTSGITLPSRIRKFKAPFFEWFELSTAVWRDINLRETALNLQSCLDKAVAETVETTLRYLAEYLDRGIDTLNCFVTLDRESGIFSPTWLSTTKQQLQQLLQAGVKLHEFIVQRTQVAFLLLEHELDIIQAVLPTTFSTPEWYLTFMTNTNESALNLLPAELRYDILPFAVKQAAQSLSIAESRIQECERLLAEAEVMQQILQSPTVNQFFNADRGRLMLFETWRPELQNRLQQLQKSLEVKEKPDSPPSESIP